MELETLPFSAENFVLLQAGYGELKFQLADLQRLVFGAKSERFVPSQPAAESGTLFALPEAEEAGTTTTTTKTITTTAAGKKKNEDHPGRRPLPPHLPRQVTVILPQGDLTGLKIIGQDVTEMLDYTPGRLLVRQYIRTKYAAPGGAGVLVGDLPEQPITRGMCGAGLLTHLIISKFARGMPIYRQLEVLKREQVELAPATVSGWMEAAATLLEPLYEALEKQILASPYLQVDESRLQVLDGKEKGKSHRGWLWCV